jgi:hypothetical protein
MTFAFANKIERFKACEPSVDVAGRCGPEMIAIVEAKLGVRFPPSYRAFLLDHGAIFSAVGSISGVYPPAPVDSGVGTVLGDTLYYRDHFQLPNHLVVIQRDQDENDPWCLDTSVPSADGEYPIVCFSLRGGAGKRLFASFGECLNEWLSLRCQR